MSSNHCEAERLNCRDVGVLYWRELRGAMREKAIVLNSLLLPVILFPFILWAMFSGMTLMQGQTQGFVSRVAVQEWPKNHPRLHDLFERDEDFKLVSLGSVAVQESLKNGEIDAFIEFLPATGPAAALNGNFKARVSFDESKERGASARRRVDELIKRYRADWLRREAVTRGVNMDDWHGFAVMSENVASKKQMGAFLMGLMLPLLFVVMVALGCFYSAVDTMAGERERNTWETLMSTAVSRKSIVTAKFLYVMTMGGLAGTLNAVTIVLTLKPILAPLGDMGKAMDFTVPLGAIPMIGLSALLLAGLVAAVMLILASFARTFAEGQALITPFYSIVPLPLLFLQIPGLKFSILLALVPIANVTMMVRSALANEFPWLQISITVVESLLLIFLCLRLSNFILRFEDFVAGSFSGGVYKFLKQRAFAKRSKTS